MKKYNVYSTLSCDQIYTRDTRADNGMIITHDSVLIKGGAGIVNDRLYSPIGTRTEVNESQLETLRQNVVFQLHEKNGFITISEHKTDGDEAGKNMNQDEDSRPLNDKSEIVADAELESFEHGLDAGKKSKRK